MTVVAIRRRSMPWAAGDAGEMGYTQSPSSSGVVLFWVRQNQLTVVVIITTCVMVTT